MSLTDRLVGRLEETARFANVEFHRKLQRSIRADWTEHRGRLRLRFSYNLTALFNRFQYGRHNPVSGSTKMKAELKRVEVNGKA